MVNEMEKGHLSCPKHLHPHVRSGFSTFCLMLACKTFPEKGKVSEHASSTEIKRHLV